MALTARDVDAHFRRVGTWVSWDEGTCDGFKHGDPDREVTGIAVGWQSMHSVLESAHDKGCNLFITHEPTFYSHMDDDEAMLATGPAQRKIAYLDRVGMTVYRCHDTWDVYPKNGVVDAWSRFLGLGEPLEKKKYYNMHTVPTTTAWELAQRIAVAVKPLSEQMVQLMGGKWQMVHCLAVGTGAITNVRTMVEMGADVVLTTDDGTTLWRDAAWLSDMGIPMIMVNHMTAEIPGMQGLVAHLREIFPGVPVEFVGPTCQYEIFASELAQEMPIRMRRDNLEALPPVALPEGYALRSMVPDQVWAYLKVMNQSCYAGEADEAWFGREFGDDPQYDPSNLMIIWKGDEPAAVAAAWQTTIDDEPWAVLHWVGAAQSERGKGLGKLVCLAALHRMRERGFTRAELVTQTWRLPAIAAYRRIGFCPWPDEPTEDAQPGAMRGRNGYGTQAAWNQVAADTVIWRAQNAG